MRTKVTLQDISIDTGLSIATVSRALRGDSKISSDNEKAIIESAQRLGYPIMQRKTPLNLRTEIFVAFLSEFHEGEFYASLFHGFNNVESARNVHVCAFNTIGLNKPVKEFILELARNQFDAAVLFLPNLTQSDYKAIIKAVPPEFPLISTAPITNPIMDTISFDSYGGGHLVAEHFDERNYKTLGIIKGSYSAVEAKFRTNGFTDHIDSRQDMELIWSFQGDYSAESGRRAFEAYWKLDEKPRAIFASNDAMAMGFIESARAKNLRIPEDVAVAGFDNLPITRYHHPTLTSVDTDYQKLAENSVKQVLMRLENPSTHHGYMNLIPVKLNVRQSS